MKRDHNRKPSLSYREGTANPYQARVWDPTRNGGRGGYASRCFTSERERSQWVRRQSAAVENGTATKSTKRLTIEAVGRDWLAHRRRDPKVRTSTWARDERSFRLWISPQLGGYAPADLTKADVERWLFGLLDHMGAPTANLVLTTLRAVVDHVEAMGEVLSANQARRAKRLPEVTSSDDPDEDDGPRVAMPRELIEAVRDAMPERFRIAVVLAFALGLRIGETVGLSVDRINRKAGTVRIDRQWTRYAAKGPGYGFALPKHRSKRTLTGVPADVFDAIDAHVASFGTGPHGLIVTRDNGEPMPAWWLNKLWCDALAALDVEPGRYVFHDLRHAFGSYSLAAGMRETRVARLMGHRNLATFLNVYAHDVEDDGPMVPVWALVHEDRATNVQRADFRNHKTGI